MSTKSVCKCGHEMTYHDLAYHGPNGSGLDCEKCNKVCHFDKEGWHQE